MLTTTNAGIIAGAGVLSILLGLYLLHKFTQMILHRRATVHARTEEQTCALEAAAVQALWRMKGLEPRWQQHGIDTMLQRGELPGYTAVLATRGSRPIDIIEEINLVRADRGDEPIEPPQNNMPPQAPQHSAV